MSRELDYYYKNKELINYKRKLKYKLDKSIITKFQYNLELSRLKHNLSDKNINNELMTDIFTLLENCNYSELQVIKDQIRRSF